MNVIESHTNGSSVQLAQYYYMRRPLVHAHAHDCMLRPSFRPLGSPKSSSAFTVLAQSCVAICCDEQTVSVLDVHYSSRRSAQMNDVPLEVTSGCLRSNW